MRPTAIVLCALAAVLGLCAPASAKPIPDEKTLVVDVLYKNGENPDDPGNCVIASFAPWKQAAYKGYDAYQISFLVKTSGAPRAETRPLTPPDYDDVYTFGGLTFTAPADEHWGLLGESWRDGPGSSDCSEYLPRVTDAIVDRKATLHFRITDTCQAARDKLTAARKAVKNAKAKKAKTAYGRVC